MRVLTKQSAQVHYHGPAYFSEFEGLLFDTRKEAWNKKAIRTGHNGHHSTIETLAQVKACIRAGQSTSLGGYPLYFITSDGAALSFEAVIQEFYNVSWDFHRQASTGWRIVACVVNYEDSALYCAHSGKRIASAYAEDEAKA